MAKEISYSPIIKELMVLGVKEDGNLGEIPQRYLDQEYLLQVIRDMDRRITDLERKKSND